MWFVDVRSFGPNGSGTDASRECCLPVVYKKNDACAFVPELKMDDEDFVDSEVRVMFISADCFTLCSLFLDF